MTRAMRLALFFVLCSGAATASPADLATIESECGKRLKLPPGGCACLSARAAELKAELTEAGMFMTQAPSQCAKGE